MHGAIFAVQIQVRFCMCAIAVQTKVRPLLSHGTEVGSKALVQFRGTSWSEVTFESRYRGLHVGSGAYPGLRLSVIMLTAGANCKNCDKKMTTIVRVSLCF
jgi:hypothetical protein